MINFASYHPFVLLVFYVSVIVISMFTFNPVLLIISLTGALLFKISHTPFREFIKNILLYSFIVFVISVSNPFFSHNGVTVLFFMNDKPVTMESLYYGAGIGIMIVSVILWFRSYMLVMSSDKFLYIFGKISPRISLVISMIFRFIPELRKQAQDVNNTRKLLGAYGDEGFIQKIRGVVSVFSIMITWALESSIETAVSMKARGFGQGKRSNFSIFRFAATDAALLAIITVFTAVTLTGLATNDLYFAYYPFITGISVEKFALPAYISFGILTFLPAIIEIKEKIRWKYFLSKI